MNDDIPSDSIEDHELEQARLRRRKIHEKASSEKKPKHAYVSIKYRDFWFYIEDDDLHSKKTFMLLLELYNLQSGRGPDKGPILTLPLGVG